jgi:hypothetical protein
LEGDKEQHIYAKRGEGREDTLSAQVTPHASIHLLEQRQACKQTERKIYVFVLRKKY